MSVLVNVAAGGYADPVDRDGTAALVARVLDRGTLSRPAGVIADDLDGRGASLSVSAGRFQVTLGATCLVADFGHVLGLMGDSIDNIPGIKGVGEKTAQALIQRYGNIDKLLASLDDLEQTKEIRAAKKLAANLRENADTARLSRELATVRRDVPLETSVESLRYAGLDPSSSR